jgi:uncharacterized protein YprB with RNaseH-like and TPR domain
VTDLFLDTETTGLNPFVDRVTCIGYRIGKNEIKILMNPDEKKLLEEFLEIIDSEMIVIGWNVKFDYGFIVLRSIKHQVDPELIEEFLACEYLDLASVVADFTDENPHLSGMADFLELKHKRVSGILMPEYWRKMNYDVLVEHCKEDVRLVSEIYERLKPLIHEPRLITVQKGPGEPEEVKKIFDEIRPRHRRRGKYER